VNSGTIWGRFVKKTRGKKSRATVPLNSVVPSAAVLWRIFLGATGVRVCFIWAGAATIEITLS
jgi:hypothetical protein